MRSYFLRLSDRAEGPYSEEQVSQLFADGQVDRDTPCRLGTADPWKTIDEYLPMLKYGTQLPSPSAPVVRSEEPPVYNAGPHASTVPPAILSPIAAVRITDIDLPFASMVKLLFKWMGAAFLVALCFIPVFILFWVLLFAIFGVLGGVFSSFPHP